MSRKWQALTVVKINALTRRGYHGDGGNLYLRISHRGAKLWAFRWKRDGRVHEAGLGGYPEVSLKQARERAAQCRDWLHRGIDPSEAMRAQRAGGAPEITFREVAEAYIEAHQPGWRNAKHRAQWRSTLEEYVYPKIGGLPVAAVDVHHVIRILSPIWADKTETATRIRQRIEAVLDAARAQGYRTGENPARWRGHLAKLLPSPARVRRVRHHPALPYGELPAFMAALEKQPGIAPKALAFTILTATRTGEVIGARWAEIDGTTWTVPADRMKGGREHRVPLSPQAQVIIGGIPRVSDFVFPGPRIDRPLSTGAMTAVLRRMGRTEITVHGFRSAFRDWARETTNFPREVAEAALAHVVRDKVEAAYARGDLFDKRRQLMEAWGAYATGRQS